MKFSDRLKTVVKYYEWLKKHNNEEDFEIMDCHQTFLVFLEIEGLLKERNEHEQKARNYKSY